MDDMRDISYIFQEIQNVSISTVATVKITFSMLKHALCLKLLVSHAGSKYNQMPTRFMARTMGLSCQKHCFQKAFTNAKSS